MSTNSEQVQVVQKKNSAVTDLVTMGIFIALFFALVVASGMFLSAIPYVMLALPLLFGLLGGVIFTVMLGKVQRSGAFVISAILVGIPLMGMAPAGMMLWFTIAGGVIAEIIYGVMGKKKFKAMATAYSVYMFCFALGEYIPFVWMKSAYIEMYEKMGEKSLVVAQAGCDLMNPLLFVILSLLTIVVAWLGCVWGRALTAKQFKRAGIV